MIRETIEFNGQASIQSECLIIMPIYNRRHFLRQAFRSLSEQSFTMWDLVIIDDGSTDEPLDELRVLAAKLPQHITYFKQSNAGPGAARATGQGFIEDQLFVAFFDSDDYWLPEYLDTAIHQLETVPELDWVYCPCKRVDYESGVTLHESTFLDEASNEPLSFQALSVARHSETYVFEDNHALAMTQLKQPIHAGFQNSVVTTRLARDIQIPSYRIGEDRYFLMAAILKGYKIGYAKEVGVIYNVHDANLSDTNQSNMNVDKAIAVQAELCRSYADIEKLTQDRRILAEAARQTSNIQFWLIAYDYYWRAGRIGSALTTMAWVLMKNPHNLRFAKTFILSLMKAPIAVVAQMYRGRH